MGDSARIEEAAHCSWRVLSWAVLASLPVAAAQDSAPQIPATLPTAVGEPAAPVKPIDLHLKDSLRLLSPEQWDTLLASQPSDADVEDDLPELGGADVEVEGERAAPKVPGGIAGLFWALRHPTQAWRIFAPAQ